MKERVAIIVLAIAVVVQFWTAHRPSPVPVPQPVLEIDLSSAFQGQTAAEDAAALAAMADAVADMIEWDGAQPDPMLKTGKALDQLRTRTRQFMFKGESLGDRHPKMRQIVGDFLASHLGTDGGEITPEKRAAWVNAYREIARSARHAISH